MTANVLRSLSAVRWEMPSEDDFAGAIADVFRGGMRANTVEVLVSASKATRARWDGNAWVCEVVEPRTDVPSQLRRKPGAGWGPGEPDDGAERLSLRPPTRHAETYVVVWRPRGTAVDREALEVVLATLFDARVLVQRVARLSRSAYADNQQLRQTLRDAGPTVRSEAMRRCTRRADAVAPYSTPVLITGPSGSGKEVVARRIHARSPRTARPFVTLNCGAIPESLAESELFGHERGAFTGATTRRKGVFERAAGGTLLLDEVGELSAMVQVKLLRVLQEGTFVPVGGEREQHSDVRVLAATHRDLSSAVAQGSFREDLFYRLAVFEVSVPSLRERSEDLPHLIRDVLQKTAARMGRSVPRVPRATMAQLLAHDWPGNVRELENAIEGALVMSRGAALEAPILRRPSAKAGGAAAPDIVPLETTIRRAIEAALTETDGKLYGPGGAAERLGLNPGTLQSKMRKLEIDRRAFVPGPARE